MKIELTERSIDIIGKTLDCALREGKISMEEYEVVLRNVNANASTSRNWDLLIAVNEMRKPTWSVHNCNSQAHIKCLEEAEKTKDASGYGTIFMGDLPEPLLNITQVKELLDNLELSGFSHGEAMAIVLKVVERG